MLFYLVISAIIVFLLSPLAGKYRMDERLALSMFIMAFVAIVRFDVGYDYPAYYEIPEREAYLARSEPVTRLFAYISNQIGPPYIFIMLFSFFTCLLAFLTIRKYSINPAISLLVYLFLCWLSPMGIIRQGLAIAVVFWGYRYILSKSFWKYLLVCIAAAMCHPTGLIGILFYFFYWYFKWWFMVIFTLVLAASIPLILNIALKLNIYSFLIELQFGDGGTFNRFFSLLLYVFTAVMYKLSGRKLSENRLFILIMPCVVLPLVFHPLYSLRIVYYFQIFYCFLVPDVLYKQRLGIKAFYILMLWAYFIIYLWTDSSSGDKSAFVPYKTVFNIEKPIIFRGD